MKLDITGLHMEITEAIKNYTEKKVEKLNKFFDDSVICHVTYTLKDSKKEVNVRIQYKSRNYMAIELTDDAYAGLVDAVDKIERQIRKSKAVIDKKRKQGMSESELDALTNDDLED